MNYQNSKIYKITDNLSDMIYIGSTCKTLEQRLKQHIANNKSYKAGKYPNFVTVFKILDNNDYKIELVENYPCATKQDLNIREGKIRSKLGFLQVLAPFASFSLFSAAASNRIYDYNKHSFSLFLSLSLIMSLYIFYLFKLLFALIKVHFMVV